MIYRSIELVYFSIELVYCSIKLTHRSTKLVYRHIELAYHHIELGYRHIEFVYRHIELVYRHIELVYRSSELLYRKSCDIRQSWSSIVWRAYWLHVTSLFLIKQIPHCVLSHFDITLAVIIRCFITPCDAHLSDYTIAVSLVFNIILGILVFYQKQNVWAFKVNKSVYIT